MFLRYRLQLTLYYTFDPHRHQDTDVKVIGFALCRPRYRDMCRYRARHDEQMRRDRSLCALQAAS